MLRLRSYDDAWAKVADAAAEASSRGGSVWIPGIEALDGPVAGALAERLPKVAVVEALGPVEVDATVHLLVQLARALGADLPVIPATVGDAESVAQTAAAAAAIAARGVDDGRVLVLVLAESWQRGEWSPRLFGDEPGPQMRWRHLHAALDALERSKLRVVLISASDAAHPWRSATLCRHQRSAVVAQDLEATEPEEVATVDRARAVLTDAGHPVSAADARAMIGLIALGEDLRGFPDGPGALVRRLLGKLAADNAALRRLGAWRLGALGSAVASLLPNLPRATTHALMAGDAVGRPSALVRRAALDLLRSSPGSWRSPADEAAHAGLAAAHRQRDGATCPATLGWRAAVAWLEKVHHLANGGAATDLEWRQQQVLGREQYWDRARHLSRVLRDFDGAAALYEDCLERFGGDSYTHHYLAYNLDQARRSSSRVREHYQAAVRIADDNPWWNTRWITFLIGHGTLREARAAFDEALERIDPDGDRMNATPWLALHLHRWVARRWLALGYIDEARAVLERVPRTWRESEVELRDVEQLVRDAEEALELGESVHPAGMPHEQRWQPQVTPDVNGRGSERLRWWPGRVIEARADGVDVVAADPPTRMAYRSTFTADEWRAMADQVPEAARGFFELAQYADGTRLARVVPTMVAPSLADEEADVIARLQE